MHFYGVSQKESSRCSVVFGFLVVEGVYRSRIFDKCLGGHMTNAYHKNFRMRDRVSET